MKGIMKNKSWGLRMVLLFMLFCPALAYAAEAYVPFYAEVEAKPNVLLVLDTSVSMKWGLDGGNADPPNRRIDILRSVLTGKGRIPVTYTVGSGRSAVTYQLYQGKSDGEYSFYNDLDAKGVFQKILLLHEPSPNNYELVTVQYYQENLGLEEFYFTFKNMYDHPLQAGNANTENATYNFDKFLRDYNAESAELIVPGDTVASSKDITNDGVPIKRVIYKAKIAGSEFDDLMVANYGQYDNLIITRLAIDTQCYKPSSGGKTYTCYKPAPLSSFPPCPADPYQTTTYFVVWNANDFNNNTALMNSAKMTLYQFIQYVQACSGLSKANTYNSYRKVSSQQIVCGDGTNEICPPPNPIPCYGYPNGTCSDSTCCPNYWPRTTGYRDIYELVPEGTSGATKVNPKTSWTAQEIADNIWNKIDYVTLLEGVSVWNGSTTVRFSNVYYKAPGGIKEANAIRRGLGLSDVNWDVNCLNSPKFCNLFDNCNQGGSNCQFTGLRYTALAFQSEGIMDTYATKIRFALFSSDQNVDPDFPWDYDVSKRGGILEYNFPDQSYGESDEALLRHNNELQELITQQDLNGDGIYPPENTHFIDPVGTSPVPWMLRDVLSYFYGVWFYDGGRVPDAPFYADAEYSGAPVWDPDPSMYNHWDWASAGFGTTPLNGHILLADPWYYNNCRSNNVIIVSDCSQSGGIQIDKALALETSLVTRLKTPNNWLPYNSRPPQGWAPSKLYVIGFFDETFDPQGADRDAVTQLKLMAKTSCLNLEPDDCDTTTTVEPGDENRDEIGYPLYATNEASLTQAFDTIIKSILAGAYSRSAPAVNSAFTSAVAGYFIIKPSKEALWMGHLNYADIAALQSLESGSTTIQATVDAADLLNERADSTREIFTSVFNNTTKKWDRVEFSSANASILDDYLFPGFPAYNELFDQNGDKVLNSTDASILINFVRVADGATYKGGKPHQHKLGAIFRSTPVAAGAPPKDALLSDKSYQAFAEAYANAPELVYVGALDGMLHTFFFNKLAWGSTLSEAWAYVPNSVLQNLWYLRLGEQHVYVDGDPSLAIMRTSVENPPDVEWCDKDKKKCWQAILFQGLRDGGPAYFSLNVTDMNTVEGQSGKDVKVRWEFTDPDEGNTVDSILGNTWSLPLVDELLYWDEDGNTLDTKVVVMFGGGMSSSGKPYEGSWLYILDADSGTPIKTILVPSVNQNCDINPDANPPNNLLTADNYADKCDLAVNNTNQVPGDIMLRDVDGDGFSDWGYFGDMQGRVWKLNIHDPDPANWGICLFFDTGDIGYDDLQNPEAECDGDLRDYSATDVPDCVNPAKRRPILYKPTFTGAPGVMGSLVYVGTGHIETEAEVKDETTRNYIFALLDQDMIDECSYAEIWQGKPGAESGWPIQLDVNEKLLTPPVLVKQGTSSIVTFRTFKPNEITNPCSAGTVYKWGVYYDTGQPALTNNTGELVRKIAEPGFTGKSLVLGNIELNFDVNTGEFLPKKSNLPMYRGYYYWWIR